MHAFVNHIVAAGVLVFLGAIVAWLAQRARQIGAEPVWPRAAYAAALALLATALWIAIRDMHALPSEDHPPAAPPGQTSPREFLNNA